MPFSTRGLLNINALWASLLVDEMCRQGVGLFVVAPGSRSTPLAVAVARAVAEGKTTWLVHPDERACAFVALGWARATGRPAAVVTTSGTAVANLLPATVEADAAGVPLLLLTADRPPELRETGANQTVKQPNTFAEFTRWRFDVPAPSASVDPAFVLTTAAHAVARTLAPAGPVHLNLAFREPLGLEPDGTDAEALLAPLGRWTETDRPYTGSVAGTQLCSDEIEKLAERLGGVERGLIVLGTTDYAAESVGASDLAERLGWPLLPDIGSQGRTDGIAELPGPVVAHYDLTLASSAFAETHRPDAVVLIGGRPLSKRLLALIESSRPDPYIVVRAGPERFDPGHVVTDRIVADPLDFMLTLVDSLPPVSVQSTWVRDWQSAAAAAEAAAVAGIGKDLNEPFVARTVARLSPALVLAASMPIRDVDLFASANGDWKPVFANRGASGIDGTVATAHGVARAFRGLGRIESRLVGERKVPTNVIPSLSRDLDAYPKSVPSDPARRDPSTALASARSVRDDSRVDDAPRQRLKPVVLLIGDLALLHDQTSLMLLRDGPQAGPPVVVVVVNNDGGGIFHFLPVARGASPLPKDVFEAAMAAPHGLRFAHAAAQFGLVYHAPGTADAFEAALAEALASGASALIEVSTDRAENEALHARITRAAADAVDAALGL